MKNFRPTIVLSALFVLAAFFNSPLLAQAPQKFSYQAIARDAGGVPLANTAISVRLNINDLTPGGTTLYSERHNVTTNQFGLFSVQTGVGTVLSGVFTAIDWASGDKYLETALDANGATGGYTFTVMGTTQLLSVPYALNADETRWIKVNGNNMKVGDTGYGLDGDGNVVVGKDALVNSTGSINNTAIGAGALYENTTGNANTAIGNNAMYSNVSGIFNTACGNGALASNTEGSDNTALGSTALINNIDGNNNTAIGSGALLYNTSGSGNTANGYKALYYNTGYYNTAQGLQALYNNSTGDENTAVGAAALLSNTTGTKNTAIGRSALLLNESGDENTAIGYEALVVNFSGTENVANGYRALSSNTEGLSNTACGYGSLFTNTSGSWNTALGKWALYNNTTTQGNTALGHSAGDSSTGATNCTMVGRYAGNGANNRTNSTALGNYAPITGDNQVNIGNTAIGSIKGQVSFTTYSDQRFKTKVETDVKGLEFILQLRPVTYQINTVGLDAFLRQGYTPREKDEASEQLHQKGLLDKAKIRYTGFLAQEVEQAAQKVGYNFSGIDKPQNDQDLYGLRYAEFVVPLVKAVQEQQEMIEQLKQDNQLLKSKAAELEALKTELQLIKDKLDLK